MLKAQLSFQFGSFGGFSTLQDSSILWKSTFKKFNFITLIKSTKILASPLLEAFPISTLVFMIELV
jgi:hypothetical protein